MLSAARLSAPRLSQALAPAVAGAARSYSTAKVVLPDLAYDYGALEPVISGKIMELHHSKHHATYVNNVNNAITQLHEAEAAGDSAKVAALQGAFRFNGGGHVNHSIFWSNLAPKNTDGGVLPDSSSALAQEVDSRFGGFEKFVEKFNAATVAVQGSGWGWLVWDQTQSRLDIMTTGNQDVPTQVRPGVVPVLGVDVWEHAYYLDYENRRPEYLKNIWQIVNWKNVEERFTAARK